MQWRPIFNHLQIGVTCFSLKAPEIYSSSTIASMTSNIYHMNFCSLIKLASESSGSHLSATTPLVWESCSTILFICFFESIVYIPTRTVCPDCPLHSSPRAQTFTLKYLSSYFPAILLQTKQGNVFCIYMGSDKNVKGMSCK